MKSLGGPELTQSSCGLTKSHCEIITAKPSLLHSWAQTLSVPLVRLATEDWKHYLLTPKARGSPPNQSLAVVHLLVDT